MKAEKFISKSNTDDTGLFIRVYSEVDVDISKDDQNFLTREFGLSPDASYGSGLTYDSTDNLFTIDIDRMIKTLQDTVDNENIDLVFRKNCAWILNKIIEYPGYTVFVQRIDEVEDEVEESSD